MFRYIIRTVAFIYIKIFNRLECVNLKNIPREGSLILYSNHISNADPVILIGPVKRMAYFMAKQELFNNRLMAKFFLALGVFPVKRGSGDISAIKNALAKLKTGAILCMFPEGTRKKEGKTSKILPGIAMLAIRSRCPVLPAAIMGNFGFLKKMKIIYGTPIDLSQYYGKELTNDDYIKISEDLMKESQKLMEG